MRLFQRFIDRAAALIRRPTEGVWANSDPRERSLLGDITIRTPDEVRRILNAAAAGNTRDQCRLSREIEEKNESIFHALDTRRNALTGCEWDIEPGDDSPAAKAAAEQFKAELLAAGDHGLDSFADLVNDLMGALIPGFAVSEIVWGAGGKLLGFNAVEQEDITFYNSFTPLLATRDNPHGEPLMADKFIFHHYRKRGKDPARGGLIRPLAWLYCFGSVNVKNLLMFVERYGMPFWLVKVGPESWESDRLELMRIIKQIGSGGGAVVKNTTDISATQAPNVTGDSYFKLLEYLEKQIAKVLLGQSATSSDGGGWSNDGAQSQVRQDILEADCRWVENTVNHQLARPWARFNFGAVPPPRLVINCQPPEDEKLAAETNGARVSTIATAITAGVLTPTLADEVAVRELLRLPEVSDHVKASWIRDGNTRRPQVPAFGSLPLSAESATPDPAAVLADEALQELVNSNALTAWLEPTADAINKVVEAGDEAFAAALAGLAQNPLFGSSAGVEETLANIVYTGVALGKEEAAGRLKGGEDA